jgi:hypothetical protein
MSYFKYKKRDASSRVDWNAISTSLVDTLKEQEANRETQRQEIDKASRETGEILSDAPQGQNRDANEWILNASSDASQFMLSQNRLLKRGLLDPREFTVNRQNVEDSFKSLQGIATSAQEEYKLTLERMAQGGADGQQSMLFEQSLAARGNAFQDFSKNQVYFNPTTGVGSIGKLVDKNGVPTLSSNASDFTTISGAANQMKARYNKFDYTTGLGAWADGIGKDIRVTTGKDGTLKVSDASGREFGKEDEAYLEVLASLDSTIDAMMVGDVQVLSMAEDLGLVKGDNYNFGSQETNWKKVGDEVGVTTENDGIVMPKSNDAIRKAVKEKLRIEALAKLDYEETPNQQYAPQQPTSTTVSGRNKRDERLGYVEEINNILTSSDLVTANEAMERRIRTTNEERQAKGLPLILDASITDTQVVVSYEKGKEEAIELSGDINQDILGVYDLITPAASRTSQRQLEKYIQSEGLKIGYPTDEQGNRILRGTPIQTSIGVADIPMTISGQLLVNDEIVSYDKLWDGPLGKTLEGYGVNTNVEIANTFNEILEATGFMPQGMKKVLQDAGKSYNVEVSGDKMTITIGDTTETIKDVYEDSDTGGTAALVSLMRDTVIKELNRINDSNSQGAAGELD